MRKINLLLFIPIIGAMLSSCKSEPAKTASEPSAPAATSATSNAKPDYYLFTTMYDAMQLRATPDLKAAVAGKLSMGELLEGSGEKSSNRAEATLGKVMWIEPFYKVNQVSSGASGWIFGGGVQTVYAGSKASAPDVKRLGAFTSYLKTLPVTKLESGKKAWEFVRANLADVKGSLADATMVVLERFLRRMDAEGEFYNILEKQTWTDQDYTDMWENKYDMSKNALARDFDAAGFCYATGEGMVFPIIDKRKFQAFFGANLTPAMQQYLTLDLKSQLSPEMSDAHVILEPQELLTRAIAWEKFNTENPYFILGEETQESERWMRITLINGEPGIQMYDYDSGMRTEDSKKLATDIIQKYPDTKLAKEVKELNELLNAEGGKKTPKVEQWVDAFLKRNESN